MSTDDFYVDPEQLLSDWLGQIEGGYALLIEHIDPDSLPYVKQAFLDGYKFGFNKKKIIEWQDQNQK